MTRFLFALLLLGLLSSPLNAQDIPTITSKVEGMQKMEGFYTLYWDEAGGKVWLEIDRFNEEFLYQVALTAGLGSNDIGLDRNQLGPSWVVRFERRGPKVLLIAPNLDYRALSKDAAERTSVGEAFASGTIHGFTVAAESDGRVLVDATPLLMTDAHGVIRSLRSQGTFRLDTSRSAPYQERTASFPDNTEMEALLTFASDNPGGTVSSVSAVSGAVTVRQRHSFIRLPGPGYTPRLHDPRAGYFGPMFMDYASPIGGDMRVRYIARHRLEKKDPTAARSEPVEPIIYYLDNGTPEPIRSALLEGGRWWNEAFEAAGYINAFRVEMLPEGADPMDVRYNIINWTHRSTRGWSYGNTITDPRTGEIIKGHVNLGSLRVRQDYLIAEGLLNPYDPVTGTYRRNDDPMLDMALARIRQLSAHEIGHTLGIQHNFAASTNDRASVMDYPAPLAELDINGRITLKNAYDTGIGEWDKVTIRYGYSDFPDGVDEQTALNAIMAEYIEQGWRYITDNDARPLGAANPVSHLWDNGTDPLETLDREMAIRRIALLNFGIGTIRPGQPVATLEEVLVPLYLRHRYQLDAVAKLVGGVDYAYNVRGDGQEYPEMVEPRQQVAALDALIKAMSPDELALPRHVRTQIPPRPPGFGQHRELFDGDTGLIFDPYAPAEVVAHQIVELLLEPTRAARLIVQRDMDSGQPGLLDMMVRVTNGVWLTKVPGSAYEAELQRIAQQVWTDALLDAAASHQQSPAVRARLNLHLRDIHAWLTNNTSDEEEETQAHRLALLDDIDRFLFRPYQPQEVQRSITTPPGSPIGSEPQWSVRVHQRDAWLEAWVDATTLCRFETP
jgi:hypothetical protein